MKYFIVFLPRFPTPALAHLPLLCPLHPHNITELKLMFLDLMGVTLLGGSLRSPSILSTMLPPEAERLTIVAFYMDDRALAWFQWMNGNGRFTSWLVFLQAVQTRFAPSQYEDPTGVLFKLTQRGTVAQYLAEFEELANRIICLPPPFLLSCFVSGLSPNIHREVQAH